MSPFHYYTLLVEERHLSRKNYLVKTAANVIIYFIAPNKPKSSVIFVIAFTLNTWNGV
jgi:hypothetical protein